jgi:hypothetical protein
MCMVGRRRVYSSISCTYIRQDTRTSLEASMKGESYMKILKIENNEETILIPVNQIKAIRFMDYDLSMRIYLNENYYYTVYYKNNADFEEEKRHSKILFEDQAYV